MSGKKNLARYIFPLSSVFFTAVCIFLLNNAYKSNDFYIKYEYSADMTETADNMITDSGNNTAVNINTAGIAELTEIPGIGEALAERIIEHRENYGAFKSIDEITSVRGIGDATFEKIKVYITV